MLSKEEIEYIEKAILEEKFHENDRIDFKLEWHKDNAALVKDLLAFANTYHHNNCYIVIGIKDQTKEIVGIDTKDDNRKNTQNITDLVSGLPFAQNNYFSVEVDQLCMDDKILDVIIIENSNQTPFFLSKRYKGVKQGIIYCRRKDTNTSDDKIASDKEIENLYKKRFHLDQDVLTQFKYLLMDYNLWNRSETIDGVTIIFHQLNPDFYIKIYSEELDNRCEFTEFSIREIHPEIGYYNLQLCYHNIALKNFTLIALDEGGKWIIWPKFDYQYKYCYEYTNSIEYLITLLLNNKSGENPYISVVLYNDETQKNNINNKLDIHISDDEIMENSEIYKNSFKNYDKENDYELKETTKRYLLARKIKCTYKI